MLRPDDEVGAYRVVRRIGGGAAADVFEVVHIALGTRHALKVLRTEWVERSDLRARFLDEGRLQASLRSPYLVRVTDTLAQPGIAALVMDLLRGETVRERLDRAGSLDPDEAVGMVIDVLRGLQVAHEAGVVHRDIKPENLFIEEDGSVKVIDFGIAKGGEQRNATAAGALGTAAYMSPEQVQDPREVDARTDVFATGACLWELLTGEPAFEGTTDFASMQAVLELDPGPPSAKADVPAWLDSVVAMALNKEGASRFATAAAFRTALEVGEVQTEAPQAPPASPEPTHDLPTDGETLPRSRRSWWPWLLAAAGTCLVVVPLSLALAVWWLWPPSIDALDASVDACGEVKIEGALTARGAPYQIRMNGRVVAEGPADGSVTFSTSTTVEPGTPVNVEARVGVVRRRVELEAVGSPLSVRTTTSGFPRETQIESMSVELSGSCIPPVFEIVGTVGPREVSQAGTERRALVDLKGLPQGTHSVALRVTRDGEVVATHQELLVVDAAPPPDDLDMDGVKAGQDCDDLNPDVRPGRAEDPQPNGRDDNCDGRIDEGTVAYDDDGDGLSEEKGDCDDTDPEIRPGRAELPDCRDQDCDGEIDEGAPLSGKDDAFEPNDAARPFDLKTRSDRAFAKQLPIVMADASDESWFEFYSQDGNFDNWGIDAVVTQMPTESSLMVEIIGPGGSVVASQLVSQEGQAARAQGTSFRDDSGMYRLRIAPRAVYKDGCPVVVRLESR